MEGELFISEGGDDVPDEIPESSPEGEEPNEIPEEAPDTEPDDPENEPNDLFKEYEPDEDPEKEPFDPFKEYEPDEDPEKEPFDPFKEYEPDDDPENEPDEEVNNPSNAGTITVVVPEQPEEIPDQVPEVEPDEDSEEKSEEFELVGPEGEPLPLVESPETTTLRRDLDEAGIEAGLEPEGEPITPDEVPEVEPDEDPEEKPEEIEHVSPEGEPLPPVESPETTKIRRVLEEAGYDPEYEPEQDSENIPDQVPEVEPEQDSESIQNPEPEQDSEFIPEQHKKKIQKQKQIKAKKLELITDPQELASYKHYEYSHILKTKYDPIYSKKQSKKPIKKPAKKQQLIQKKKPKKAKKLEPITDPKELGEYKHYEYSHTIKTKYSQKQAQKKPEKLEKKQKNIQKQVQKTKPKKIKKLELITERKELGEYKHYEYSHTIKTKYSQKQAQKKPEKSEKKSIKIQKPVQKKKLTKVKKLESITDRKELGEYKHYEYSHTIKSESTQKQAQKKIEKSEKKSEISQKTKKKSKPEEIKELELIVDLIETEEGNEVNQSKTDSSSEQTQNSTKKSPEKQEIVKSTEVSKEKVDEITDQEPQTQRQTQQSVKTKKQEKIITKQKTEPASSEILKLREKFRKETGKRPIYDKKETKGFREWLEKQKKLIQKRQESTKKSESREDWEIFLENWLVEASEKELSKEIKEELISIIRKYHKLRDIYRKLVQSLERKNLSKYEIVVIESLLRKLEKITEVQEEIFKNMRVFRAFYNENIRWDKPRILDEREKFIKHLAQKLKNLKNIEKIQKAIQKKWNEILKENLYKNSTLSLKEKSIINEILLKEELTEGDKKVLISILSKLPTEQLISLLGEDFRQHTQNYVKWGWDFSIPVKRLMLNRYLKKLKVEFKEEERSKIKIPHFKQKVIENLKNLFSLIDGTTEQKELIWAKSLEILDEFILSAEKGEFALRKDTNLRAIAGSIIYTVILSNRDMPKITLAQISIFAKTFDSTISRFYSKYFKHLHPSKRFLFSTYQGFKRIRNIISAYFFELLKDPEIEISKILSVLRENIQKNINLPSKLTKKDIEVLQKFMIEYQNEFIEYFSGLCEVIRQLIITGRIHKQIGAFIMIKFITEILEENGINMLQTSKTFYRSVIEIFDFLKENFSNFLPTRMIRIKGDGKLTKKEFLERHYDYIKIVGKRLKLYVIRHIYNGKYFKNGEGKCPECLKEELTTNTDISRLPDLEFHHHGQKKENMFSEDKLYNMFLKNRTNPHFLEDLIKLMEKERVELLCKNHHAILHDEYYRYFNYLINWKNIFSLPPEQIHILIWISVENFYKSKKSVKEKEQIRKKIVRKLKKRYIIESIFGEYCPACGEFNIRKHLPAFHFNHLDEKTKTVEATDLYNTKSCSEIAQKLKKETGGYVCGNCHYVLHYKYIHLLDEIYNDEKVVRKVLDDYKRVSENFKLIQNIGSIGDPLKKMLMIRGGIERYLSAIYEISKLKGYADTHDLKKYLKVSSITKFFRKKRDFIKNYINIETGRSYHPTKYTLNNEGKKFVSLMYHFRDYYKSLEQD